MTCSPQWRLGGGPPGCSRDGAGTLPQGMAQGPSRTLGSPACLRNTSSGVSPGLEGHQWGTEQEICWTVCRNVTCRLCGPAA